MRWLGLILVLSLSWCGPKEKPVADTLYLDEPFSNGAISFDYTPPYWNAEDLWGWHIHEGDPPTNYTRMRSLYSVNVASGQLEFDADGIDGNGVAVFSVSGGTGNDGFGDNCPTAATHFVSVDATFDPSVFISGYFSASHDSGWPWGFQLEIVYGEVIFKGMDGSATFFQMQHSVHYTVEELAALGKVTIRMEWRYATSAGGDNVNNDGYARLWIGTTLIYDMANLPIKFYSRPDLAGQTRNTFNTVSLGNWGPFAKYFDNLKAGAGVYTPDDSQYARPISDVAINAWTPSSGVALYPMVNEVTPDDGTFISSPSNPVDAVCEVALNDVEPFGDNPGDIVITIRGTFDST